MVNLSSSELELQTELIKTKIDTLIAEDKEMFLKKYEDVKKDEAIYSKLGMAFFLGLHHIYINDFYKAMKNISIFLLSCLAFYYGYGVLAVLFIVLLVLLDINNIFDSQKIVQSYNNYQANNILQNYETNIKD